MTNSGRGVLEGAFALLDVLEERGDVRLAALASASGLPKSTAHRLLDQLVELGAVERAGAAYRVGPQLFRLGRGWQPYPGLLAASHAPLRRLAESAGATVTICVLQGGRTMAAAGVPGEVAALAPVRPGTTWPATTAAGKVLMAWAAPGLPLDPMPGPWRRTAREIRDRGAAFDRGEVIPGVACVAVPLHGPHGELVASVASLVPAERDLDTVAENLTRTARAIHEGLRRTARGRAPVPGGVRVPVPRDGRPEAMSGSPGDAAD
ncbi:IclR family transcriptional regulator [Streptomyces sp. NPDC088387]|uniref:IclR family transcriptional regulator n=1 Tax=Streptomyces sp. NPDC088387 TaxID=3365859 RepID=UPI00380CB1DE